MDEIKNDVESTCQNKREEETEACQVDIALCTTWNMLDTLPAAVWKFLLELARSDASIVSRILNHTLLSRFEKVDFSRYTEHALERIGKQDGDKAA